MEMLGFLLIPLLFACLVGYIWLVVRAFKTSIGWGVGVFLLSPLTAIIYAVEYWDEAKKPFLFYMTPIGAALVIVLYMFMSSGNPNSVETGIQASGNTQQGTPLEEGKIKFMEKSLEFLEKFSQSEKDQQFLAVMRKYVHQTKPGSTDAQRIELKQDVLKLLERPDLTEEQRQDLTKILHQLEQQEKTTTAMDSKSIPQQNVTASPVEKAAIPDRQGEATPKVQSASLNSEPKNSLHQQNEASQKQGEIATPQSQSKDTPKVEIPDHQREATPDVHSASLKPKSEQSPYKAISIKQAKNYIGSSVILIGPNGVEQQCILADVSGNILRFEKHMSAGVFSFYYKASEIKSLKVYQQ